MRDVALVPQRDVLEPDDRGRPYDARKAGNAFGDLRVPLVRHRGRALHPARERLLDLSHLGPREVAYLGREAVEGRRAERQRAQNLRVTVARDHLRRDGVRLEPEPLTRGALDLGVDRRVRPHGSRELPDTRRLQCPRDSRSRPVEFERPPRELPAERRRLGVDPVGAPDTDRVAVLLGPPDHRRRYAVDLAEEEHAGVTQLKRERRVHDVGRRQTEVHPPTLGPELLDDSVDERSGVVIRRPLDLRDAFGGRWHGSRANRLHVSGGNRANLSPAVERCELDLQPAREPFLLRPDAAHLRPRVPGDHRSQSRARSGRHHSSSERILAASTAAFFALSTPTVATGTPGGIWTIESSASSPSRTLIDDRSGTPI